MSRPRTIILGASHWHVPLCTRAIGEEHNVVGISDEDVSLVRGLADAWNAPVEADWRNLVDLPNLGLAYVFGPHNGMAEKCFALIERGIPLVVEKPLGTSLSELARVREAAEAAGVPVTVPLVQRDGPVDRWLAKAGRPTYQRASFVAGPPSRYLHNGNPWMLDPVAAGGGCLANLAPHFVDLFLQGSNESADTVDSRLSSVLHGADIEDHASLIVTTTGGREAIIEVGYAFPNSPLKRYCSFTSAGEAGFASINSDGSATFTSEAGITESAMINVDSDPLYDAFVRRVAETLEDGFQGLPTLAQLEDAMRPIWQAYDHHGGTEDGRP
ncbi:oxidoreductase domain protein [Pseudarthrobacter chlorophenolicus A6]|uniref:Oxidoreductase domain protein n=1 Tax=Pseudarthrobacter chlorophenolicus (strain ATCC 700700 / DSM 12829 / CIP 107037 / JCM 12360 / KCTC 9906 / NCIMB 13794 / A6) TaxID=452863 RepID=B8H750_PSECP|nr:Gfo/Idh/MocA family oxidoreductase [Pseudarthrobacter chlorophenolicus]ACL41652.1 oxidoreductase domain protein [Pseudarthrobacter chlorophenolicus A6]SDQ60597.1 Predicted dehydrogenase [Pseudarthrobacter chlorophenolicus]